MCNSFCYEEFSKSFLIICVTWNGCIVFSENSCTEADLKGDAGGAPLPPVFCNHFEELQTVLIELY